MPRDNNGTIAISLLAPIRQFGPMHFVGAVPIVFQKAFVLVAP